MNTTSSLRRSGVRLATACFSLVFAAACGDGSGPSEGPPVFELPRCSVDPSLLEPGPSPSTVEADLEVPAGYPVLGPGEAAAAFLSLDGRVKRFRKGTPMNRGYYPVFGFFMDERGGTGSFGLNGLSSIKPGVYGESSLELLVSIENAPGALDSSSRQCGPVVGAPLVSVDGGDDNFIWGSLLFGSVCDGNRRVDVTGTTFTLRIDRIEPELGDCIGVHECNENAQFASDCIETPGCNWTPGKCAGTSSNCNQLSGSEAACVSEEGCTYLEPTCLGDPTQSCLAGTTVVSCEQRLGCYWLPE